MYKDNQYIIPDALYWPEILRKDIPRSPTSLQPIYEAFTNAIEAIQDAKKIKQEFQGQINIDIYLTEKTIPDSFSFSKLIITDNGVGFNEEQFQRFNTFRDNRKNYKNLGSGRIQYVHYFDTTRFESVFSEKGRYYKRVFTVSKKASFIENNAIVKHNSCHETDVSEIGTKVVFKDLLIDSAVYDELTEQVLKEKLLERYIHYFCHNINSIPKISIKLFIQEELKKKLDITKNDIPRIDSSKKIKLYYSKIEGFQRIKTSNFENFKIEAFKINKKLLKTNKVNLVSKGEVIEESQVKLESISTNENIKGYKFLFLVSSDFIDKKDTNIRGVLNIKTKSTIMNDMFSKEEEIVIEDIEDIVNKSISIMYPEIEKAKQKHVDGLNKLKEMFLLDDETANDIQISINDSETDILKKFYEAEAKKAANLDAKIKESIDRLEKLDTSSETYGEDLKNEIQKLVVEIPLQNKQSLTQYVARRKLVLELFNLINNKKLTAQLEEDRNRDEQLLHNLIFQQSNLDSEDSDLWLINEDFIYFKGVSEKRLKDITINGVKLLREDLNKEEEEFRTSLDEDRYAKRPDILLFPEEGKCLIIEFKNPNVNVSDHLNQINNYASLIWNFSNNDFKFDTFYGYLIGEKISTFDVRTRDGDFKEAYNFDYLFRPAKIIPGLFRKDDATLYTEVIKYSTLYDRAKKRNDVFIKKLGRKEQ